MFKIHQEIFNPERKEVFEKLSSWKDEGYLAGGTALALQLGHRESYDFDIFLPKALSPQLVSQCQKVFGNDINIRINNGNFLMLDTAQKISLDFVYYWFPLLSKAVSTSSIWLASVEDIAADKAHTIGRRAQWRDYVDLFYILYHNIMPIDVILKNAQKKFSPEFNVRQFLQQLTYWDDIYDFKVKFLRNHYETEEIKKYLEFVAKQQLKTILG